MNADRLSFDTTNAIEAITGILSCSHSSNQSRVVPLQQSRHVVTLHSSNFQDLEQFRESYLTIRRPALCFVTAEELPRVLPWIRDSDDVAVVGESPELTEWRYERIARAFVQQLDPLTEVYQRSHLVEKLEEICPRASSATPVSLVLLDIDNLKNLNDLYGPDQGNNVLKRLAQVLQTLCDMAMVARTRGGEFAVLVESPESKAGEVAEVLLDAINREDWCRIKDVTTSIGVAGTQVPCSSSALLTKADSALYSAKANGRNRVVCFREIAELSDRLGETMEVISLENKARVMSERVTSFVTQQSRLIMQNLRREADTDALTQLFNRRYLDRKLAEDFQQARDAGRPLCVVLIDVDHFGLVNKKFGWPTGDKVLREISDLIRQNVRGSDWVGRYGGEELCIVMPNTERANGIHVSQRIRKAVASQTFRSTDDQPVAMTLSAGVVELAEQHRGVEQLLDEVSQLTLQAKQQGRNRVCG